MDVPKLLDNLEALVENSWRFMNKAWGVDLEEFFELVNKIRTSLPEDVWRASRLTKDSQRIYEDARHEAEQIVERATKEAERILADARAQAARIIDEHEVTRLATAQAKEIREKAERDAAELKRDADEYALGVLEKLEAQLRTASQTLQREWDQLCKESLHGVENHIETVVQIIHRGREKLGKRLERSDRTTAAERQE
ncbi:MAG: hypothetical protein ACP5R4_02420 [Armatimonadota bacterium]